jgi:hypothetical protein
VNARDRIGNGPWYNAKNQQIAANVAELHGDTLEQARLGNRVNKITAIDEKGEMLKGVGDQPNEHDILTGSLPDGRAYTDAADHTCKNWTSSSDGTAQVLERLRAEMPLTIARHERNQGLGATIRDGLRLAADSAGGRDVIVTMDADESHDPVAGGEPGHPRAGGSSRTLRRAALLPGV